MGGAVLLFAQQPFTTDLIVSNRKWFRYEWIWHKTLPLGFLNANRMPLRAHEEILVFYEHLPKYRPQKWIKDNHPYRRHRRGANTTNYGSYKNQDTEEPINVRFPTSVIAFYNGYNAQKAHPTEKPVPLLEYMVKTYTDEGDTVLDSCMGAGSCGVACQHIKRNFVGIEKDQHYFDIAKARIEEAAAG